MYGKTGDKSPMFGKKHTEETKRKMSEALLGKPLSEETKKKLSEAHNGKKLSEETKKKIGEANIGKTLSEETKQKISEAQLGDKHTRAKRVYQCELDGTPIHSFGSAREAARHLGKKDGSAISRCACGDCNTAYGFKWSYIKTQL